MKRRPVIPRDTIALQAKASDPRNSVWVSANAGSGKTHVLSQRVTRLLLEGTDPSKILCLTYTRAAAANMANRVFGNLAKWTMLDDQELSAEIEAIDGSRPGRAKLARARRLFATALETPGGLKIQTIHAFCEALLHQFPLEANIAGHFEMLDQQMEAALVGEARRDMISGAASAENVELAEAFAFVLERGGEFGLDSLLSEIVQKRDRLRRFIEQVASPGEPPFIDLFDEFGFEPGDTAAGIAGSVWPDAYFDENFAREYLQRAERAGKSVAENFARSLLEACRIDDPLKRLQGLKNVFLTKRSGEGWQPRSIRQIAAKNVANHFTRFEEEFDRMAIGIRDASDRLALFRMLEGSRAALTIADWLIARYEQLKSARGFLDFNDLITRTVRLLARQDAGPWVQYKLDKGIDHILIDEAQDTSPDQWDVVKKLAAEFFAGLGARDDIHRTIFAVGDEKQSIYSFQGADPESFASSGHEFSAQVRSADGSFEPVRLTWSFRSTDDVLSAVDLVFAREEVRKGLTRDPDPLGHKAIRAGAAGYVEVWPSLGTEAVEEPDDWRLSVDHTKAPAVRVAENIAATIEGWIRSGEIIEGSGKRLTAGDVLVLVRKRDRFVHALSRSLKSRGVPVAGADRLSLPGHIAIKDLAALGRFLLQPEDDLSLAAVLKSPIFGESEETLFELAWNRAPGVSLIAALRRKAETDLLLTGIVGQLDKWANEAAFRPVFEFYAGVLGRDQVRKRMVGRLGHEAGDILDEFLNFCLAEEQTGLPGLEAFLATLDSAGPEIKREMDQTRNEVRIMTVHAAKGLEAPVVFLVDSGAAPFSEQHLSRLMPFEPQRELWSGSGFLWRSASDVANGFSREVGRRARQKAEEEYRRLLYVGMTRAEDRLIVCGYHGKRTPDGGTWHSIVGRALSGSEYSAERQDPQGGEAILRYRVTGMPEAAAAAEDDVAMAPVTGPLPAELFETPAAPPALPRPLSPSGASALIEEGNEPVVSARSPVLDAAEEPSFAIQRGLAMHRLLQMLPGLPEAERQAAALRYLGRAGAAWSEADRQQALTAVDAILGDAVFAPLFSESSRAEVSIMGKLAVRGRERAVSGKIDRLTITPDAVMIVDYKTNRPAPTGINEVPAAHVLQMALYRALLQPLYPGKAVTAALLFTEAARLIALPAATMDAALARLTQP
ncbi:DNA helicase/exodeoxyribonuclease V, subunit A [Mesorhizobium albiziae]|uniref:DNA 3'-5' helicase n=1 Tax=Neomesorhizobium albiziae TaxID=335020 RepID=A0A1I4BE54_9HYPH|nr:double-strand break repair helicase AddA [Mesorhizobium albiziae]GLS29774.1 double-strand break repair helicase AddA [Mesorhizobium albiziae]SFK66309.1 DNA helicase/exodeoxyribonuclease V, subunit A [Mesorhizobium albiziae]